MGSRNSNIKKEQETKVSFSVAKVETSITHALNKERMQLLTNIAIRFVANK
ncbi:MAG: hypothetical protein SCK28_12680 [Bacillota bacterium]|nr:hypothetical protein [Bacillota bacterium]